MLSIPVASTGKQKVLKISGSRSSFMHRWLMATEVASRSWARALVERCIPWNSLEIWICTRN